MTEPFAAGSAHATEIFPVPAVTSISEGESGAVAGVIALDEDEGREAVVEPAPYTVEFVTTLNVYSDPFDNPVTVQGLVELVHVAPVTSLPLLS
jgi:uncharacterized iron-regulated membrane protein